MSTDSHDAHDAHDAHGDAPAAAPAPPPPTPEPAAPPPINPATREQEVAILQACFHISVRSSFAYFAEPGALLVRTEEDKRLKGIFDKHLAEDMTYADRIADLVRERGTEPAGHAFLEKFTRMNFLTYESAAEHIRDDLANHVEVLERVKKLLPPGATPTVPQLVSDLEGERHKHLAFWSDAAKRHVDAYKAKLAAKKAAPAAKKH
jgi:hypothetical protein